jgi:hypothetical protein
MEMQASQPAKGTHNSLSLSVGGSPSAPVLMKPEDEVDAPAAEPSSSSSASTAPKTSPLLNLFASVSKHASSLKELPTPLSKRLPSPAPPKVALLLNLLPTLCTKPVENAEEGVFLTCRIFGTESSPSLSWTSSAAVAGNPILRA